jgi:hypothetical protein
MPSKEQLNTAADEIKYLLLVNEPDEPVKNTVGQFIDEINNVSKMDACRLLLCIGIDLQSGAVTASVACDIILKTVAKRVELWEKCQSFPEDKKPGLLAALGNVIRETNKESIFRSNFLAENHDPYVQVVSTSKLIQHTQDQAQGKLAEDNKRVYLSQMFKKRTIPVARWKQNNSTVFVVHQDDYMLEVENGIDQVLDALGVEANMTEVIDGEYVSLFYQDDFEGTFFQPCTFHGNWGSFDESKSKVNDANPYFISYIDQDGYGRTHSTSGNKQPARERVHSGFAKASRIFQFRYIRHAPLQTANFQQVIDRNPGTAVDEAYKRYLQGKERINNKTIEP